MSSMASCRRRALFSRRKVSISAGRDAALLDGGQLAGLELGQGDDVAVHARDHALDDLGPGGGGERRG